MHQAFMHQAFMHQALVPFMHQALESCEHKGGWHSGQPPRRRRGHGRIADSSSGIRETSGTSLLPHETVQWCHPFSRVIFGATASRSRL
eukprot:6704017-Prymnesium_polylepis.1